MMAPPPQGTPLTLRIPRLSGVQALLAAEQSLLAGRQAARRALEVITAYEARHGEESLSR
jgi:hypothetical protein